MHEAKLIIPDSNQGGAARLLAEVLLRDVERIAACGAARIQELLPAYAKVPRDQVIGVAMTNTRVLLEAIRDRPPDLSIAEVHFRASGETRARQGITSAEMLEAWRIGVEVVREEANALAQELEIDREARLEFDLASLQWSQIGMRVAASAHHQADVRELERLAKQQAALRRVATMVAGGSSPEEIFVQVAEEVALLLGLETAGVVHYDTDGKVAIVGSWGTIREVLPVGGRLAMDGDSVARAVYRTRRPSRVPSYERGTGELAAAARRAGLRSSVASPIVVGGRLWGSIVAATTREEPLPQAAESRIAEFTELVATAIANTESRAALAASEARAHELAREQAALRRVATQVARGVSSDELFAVVSREIGELFGANAAVARFEADGPSITTVGQTPGVSEFASLGSRIELEEFLASTKVYRTGRAARNEPHRRPLGWTYGRTPSTHSTVAAPIVVEGSLWGVILVAHREALPSDTEQRVERFSELVATAIANAESRAALAASEARAHELAREQAALRRVATLVAEDANAPDLFAAVAQEVSDLCDIPIVGVHRFDADRTFTMMGLAGATGHNVGDRRRVDDVRLAARILDTGRPARWHHATAMPGRPGTAARDDLTAQVAGAPIVVDGSVWGFIAAGGNPGDHLPDHTEERLARFTELVATAIANSQAREHLAELAGEQAALRRVATTVARGAAPDQVVRQVAEEVGRLLGVELTAMYRFEPDGYATIVTNWGEMGEVVPAGRRVKLDGDSVTAKVFRTARPARIESYEGGAGMIAADMRTIGMRSGVASPIVVNRRLWGAIAAATSRADPLPSDAEARIAEFTGLVATAIANVEARSEVQRLADEQAALRRVATLVASGVSPGKIFSAVSDEVGRLFGAYCSIARFDPDGSAMVVVGVNSDAPPVPLGARWKLEDFLASTAVYRTGRPARKTHTGHLAASGEVADSLRAMGFVSTVAIPIVVQGRPWGTITVSDHREDLPPGTEERVERFTELVGTAIANAESRGELAASEARAHELAREQAALRRVATLVAEGVSADALFSAVTREVAGIIDVPMVGVHRYEGDGTFKTMGVSSETSFTVGSRWPIEKGGLADIILATGRPARKEDYSRMPGPLGAAVRRDRMLSTVGVPIVVDGSVWGFMVAAATPGKPLPDQTEERFARFIELVATAIANSQARTHIEQLADEQAALRRVATLVAQGVQPAELFSAVTQELARLFLDLEPSLVPSIIRFDPGPEFVLVGSSVPQLDLPIGSRWGLKDLYVSTRVFRTGRSARVDEADIASRPGSDAELLRRQGFLYQVGSPIVVEGQLWGAMTMNSSGVLPPDTDERVESFTELIATAIANAESRDALRQLAEEQAALRRVATLVAQGAPPSAVLDAVAAQMQRVLDADAVTIGRYEPGDEITVVAHRSPEPSLLAIGTRVNHEGKNVTAMVRATEQRVRLEDLGQAHGGFAELFRCLGMRAVVGTPIVVDGRLWGTILGSWNREEAPPVETEEGMAQFAALLDTAIANADSRDQLTASRARLVTEADEARRRVVRDLHDGAQQRLVHTIVTLKLAQRARQADDEKAGSLIAEALEHAQQGNAELRELAHGILPAILTQGGLEAGVKSLVSRLDLPVAVDIPAQRFATEIEASAYFIVAEALTNVVKHSHAGHAEVRAFAEDGMLHVQVRDDGRGGADPKGHGLQGLGDRVTALGGRLKIESPADNGTILTAELPLLSG